MDKTLKNILCILTGLVILSSFSTGWFFVAKERLYNNYVNLEDLFKTTVEKLNTELSSSNKENTELKTKLEAVNKEMAKLESRNKDLRSQYEKVLGESGHLNKELAMVKEGKSLLEKQLKDMGSDKFIAGLLKEKASLEVGLEKLKVSSAPKDLEIEKLKRDILGLDVRISKIQEEKDLLEERLKDSTEVAEILSKDLVKERNRNEEYEEEFKNVKLEKEVLKTKVSELEEVSDRFNRVLTEKENMQLAMSNLKKDLEYRDETINKLKLALEHKTKEIEEVRAEAYHSPAEVELPPIILERQGQGATRISSPTLERIGKGSGLRGRIVTVNREHSFVVVDLGEQDGVKVKDGFDVYRGDNPIGSLQVIQTRERISACDIKDVKYGFWVEIDDIVIKR